jgi:YD repeat-containing protein
VSLRAVGAQAWALAASLGLTVTRAIQDVTFIEASIDPRTLVDSTYQYDATGNRTAHTQGGMRTAYTYDALDQLLTASSGSRARPRLARKTRLRRVTSTACVTRRPG